MTTRVALAFALLMLGCGARTGLDAPDAGAPVSAERCDGLDDDGDGRVDEGVPALTCGVCEVEACVDGHPGMCPAEGTGAPELCNAIDDDCDGRVDEGLPFELVGDPVVLRDVDEGSVGTCERCAHVIHPTLQTMGGRLYAIWNFDYSGYIDRPTSFVRRLDDHGRPDGPPRPLFDVPITQIRFAPSHDGLTIASFCERVEDTTDHWRSAFFDADAQLVGDIRVRTAEEERCGGVPEVTWNGSTHFFLRRASRLRVETADATGRSLATESYEIGAQPRFARWGSDVFLAGSYEVDVPDSEALRLHRFDRNARRVDTVLLRSSTSGTTASNSVLVEGPSSLLVLEESWSAESDPSLTPASFSWDLIEVDPDAGTSSSVGRIDLAGQPSSPDVVRRAPDELVGAWTLRPDRTDRTTTLTEVMRFTSHGEELGRWTLPPGERTSDYVVRVHGGRVFVIYLREILARRQNRVELLELGCIP